MTLKHLASAAALGLGSLAFSAPASACCGFFVAKADTDLFNDASKVALVRDGDRTVITMASDYRGEPSEFAMVIPVVDVPEREQINVANPGLIEHLDEYTAPRLVEYHDENPCDRMRYRETMAMSSPPMPAPAAGAMADAAGLTTIMASAAKQYFAQAEASGHGADFVPSITDRVGALNGLDMAAEAKK